jgi:hypothetical protein
MHLLLLIFTRAAKAGSNRARYVDFFRLRKVQTEHCNRRVIDLSPIYKNKLLLVTYLELGSLHTLGFRTSATVQ